MTSLSITQTIRTTLLGAFSKGTTGLGEKVTFFNLGVGMVNALTGGLGGTVGNFLLEMAKFDLKIADKLTQIAKTFFNAGGKWINQAVAGFNDHKKELVSAIQGIVNEVNAVLRKIITSFAITIKLPSWLGGTTAGSSATVGTPPKVQQGGNSDKHPGKASGGPVFAGHTYDVAEFYRPETFTPASNGRIDALKQNKDIDLSDRTINKLADKLGLIIPTATVKAMNNA